MRFFVGPDLSPYDELRNRDFKSETGEIIRLHFVSLYVNGEGIFIINESNCQDGIDANNSINILCRIWDEEFEIFKWYCSIENGIPYNSLIFHKKSVPLQWHATYNI